ncbi:histidine utilization repressor [Mesorhizobium sp. CN2-181]|uniref:histidine utilization repressor n=1 Tax=Mesorhizobium yinganensis TaxID=3157707 RepID=UPI0032B7FCBC
MTDRDASASQGPSTGLPDTASPLYEKVKDFVLANIGSGKWSKDQRLPSENELVSALGVSRMTVHRALRELTSEGHLLRIQGVGTFVAPPKPQSTLIEIANIASEIRARGSRHRAEVVLVEQIAEPEPVLVAAFEFTSRQPIGHSIITHFENDVPVQLEERFVNSNLVPDYHRQDFSHMTTYDYLQQATPLTEVEQVISAVPADAYVSRHLAIRQGDPCLLLHRRTWSGPVIATVNSFTYAGSYSLGSRYAPTLSN